MKTADSAGPGPGASPPDPGAPVIMIKLAMTDLYRSVVNFYLLLLNLSHQTNGVIMISEARLMELLKTSHPDLGLKQMQEALRFLQRVGLITIALSVEVA